MLRVFVWSSLPALVAGCAQPPAASTSDIRPAEATAAASVSGAEVPSRLVFTPCNEGLPLRGMWKCDPVFADVNGDGFLDLAATPRLEDGPHVWLGNGRGQWTDSSSGLAMSPRSCGGGVSVGDVNVDGYPDLVVADHCSGAFVYLGDGSGQWQPVTEALYPQEAIPADAGSATAMMYKGAEDIDVGDVDGDGLLDLLVGSSDQGGINVYLGDGTGRNWKRSSEGLPTSGWTNRLMLVDMNGDERLDIAAAYCMGPRVWLNDGEGAWTPASTGLPEPITYGLFTGLAVGDVNEDGRVDIAVANWVDGPEVHLQQEDGSWRKSPDVFPEMRGGAIGLALGDIDGEGHLDIVVSGRLGLEGGYIRGVFLLRGDGAGGWTYMKDCGLPSTGLAATVGIALGDINDDGILDVAASSGLIVESAPGRREPVLPTPMLVWSAALKSAAPNSNGEGQAEKENPIVDQSRN